MEPSPVKTNASGITVPIACSRPSVTSEHLQIPNCPKMLALGLGSNQDFWVHNPACYQLHHTGTDHQNIRRSLVQRRLAEEEELGSRLLDAAKGTSSEASRQSTVFPGLDELRPVTRFSLGIHYFSGLSLLSELTFLSRFFFTRVSSSNLAPPETTTSIAVGGDAKFHK